MTLCYYCAVPVGSGRWTGGREERRHSHLLTNLIILFTACFFSISFQQTICMHIIGVCVCVCIKVAYAIIGVIRLVGLSLYLFFVASSFIIVRSCVRPNGRF